MSFKQTPSQTVGPFFAYGLTPEPYGYPLRSLVTGVLAEESSEGEPIRIVGQVFDGEGKVVPDALIEIWQADAAGRYAGSASGGANRPFIGFGRVGTGADPESRFIFETVKPGVAVPGQAPHIGVAVFMRGLLTHAYTRLYFSDEAAANAQDPVLARVPEARRATLIAERRETGRGIVYRFDIHMQGARETVFFDV